MQNSFCSLEVLRVRILFAGAKNFSTRVEAVMNSGAEWLKDAAKALDPNGMVELWEERERGSHH